MLGLGLKLGLQRFQQEAVVNPPPEPPDVPEGAIITYDGTGYIKTYDGTGYVLKYNN